MTSSSWFERLLWTCLGVLVVARTALRSPVGLDYPIDAQASIDALARGDLGDAFAEPPLMGPVSILLRAPAVAVVNALDGGDLTAYRVGSFLCLLILPMLATVVAMRMSALGQPSYAQVAVVLILVGAFVIKRSLDFGHPEEGMAGGFAVLAVLAALAGRVKTAVALVVAAAATKPTALLAIAPVYFALPPEQRGRRSIRLAAIAGVVLPPLAAVGLAVAGQFASGLHPGTLVFPASVEWPFAERELRTVFDSIEYRVIERRTLDANVAQAAHLGVAFVPIPLALLYMRRPRPREAALALLALVMLLRCAIDPVDNVYYHLPFVLALATWEALHRRGLPVVSIVTVLALWLLLDELWTRPNVVNAGYLILVAALTWQLVAAWRMRPLGAAGGEYGPAP